MREAKLLLDSRTFSSTEETLASRSTVSLGAGGSTSSYVQLAVGKLSFAISDSINLETQL